MKLCLSHSISGFAPARVCRQRTCERGFALVVALALMILLTVIAVGLLTLASVEMRKSSQQEARSIALANARMGLMMALGQLQQDLGDDRRISADASILLNTKNPGAVGVWNGWSPDLASKSGSATSPRVNYSTAKGQTGFRSWLVSSADPTKVRQLAWHTSDPAAVSDPAKLFAEQTSGFNLMAEKVPYSVGGKSGSFAWAVTQENTKARINIGTDESKRISAQDQMQTPSRPDLTNSSVFKHPAGDWTKRSVTVCDLPQSALDPAYGVTPASVLKASKDYTTGAYSLLTNPVKGGVKIDLSTGFDLSDNDFSTERWSTPEGTVNNPFRGTTSGYKGQKPLFQPMHRDPLARVFMKFDPASVDHKFEINGAPTFDTLRSYYRIYRHLYNSNQGGTTAFERPYSHIASKEVSGRPSFGLKSHPSLMPVVDRVYFILSIMAKQDGTPGVLITPFVTIWNPHNVPLETEGLVVYPWIDFAVFWRYNVTPASNPANKKAWEDSLSRSCGEGYGGHGRSSRPYFYFHLTQSGNQVTPGTQVVSPAIHLESGEVRVFCLAESSRRDLETKSDASGRIWRMKPANSPSDLTGSLKNGVFLNLSKSLTPFTYKLQPGDIINANTVSFDRNSFNHITGVADSWQIRNPTKELMASTRPASGAFPELPEQANLYFVGEIHSLNTSAGSAGVDSLSYPSFTFEEIRENPRMVGGVMTYHRTANSGTAGTASLVNSDLMFTTNPRQAYINSYLSNGGFQAGPHYETLMTGGTSLVSLAMETSMDGRNAYYGASHSASKGRTNPVFFEVPRSPTLSLGSFQHCDLATTPYGPASQIGNSWVSPYVPTNSATLKLLESKTGPQITPDGFAVYDYSYLANEALFDSCYLSGAAPEFGSRKSASGSPAVWKNDQISESQTTEEVLAAFFADPASNPLRNPRMKPYRSAHSAEGMKGRLAGPAKSVRLAAHLLVEGGFNINSTSEEAWTAVLASLRGAKPASADKTAQSRFRHILSGAPTFMKENDGWSGFRTLSDQDIKTLAKNLVAEIKLRGPFLSLGEFVNRRVSSDRNMNVMGALQSAIDKSGINNDFKVATFASGNYPFPENLPAPNTGTNTPGWLSQADILHGLAPYISPRSDTFIIRSMGEAKSPEGKVLATARLEALVQRVPDWVDPQDDAASPQADLKSQTNKSFGRRFRVVSVRQLSLDSNGDPV